MWQEKGLVTPVGVLCGVDDTKGLFPFSTSVMEDNATYHRRTNVLIWEQIQDFNHHNNAVEPNQQTNASHLQGI